MTGPDFMQSVIASVIATAFFEICRIAYRSAIFKKINSATKQGIIKKLSGARPTITGHILPLSLEGTCTACNYLVLCPSGNSLKKSSL